MMTQTHSISAGSRLRGAPSAAERARAFRAALRHSTRVRTFRILLPFVAVALTGFYFLPSRIAVKTKDGEISVKTVNMTSKGSVMLDPHYRGVHEKHGVYDIRAKSATRNRGKPNLVKLDTIRAEVVAKDGKKTTLDAPSGIYHTKKEELTFDNGAAIGGDAGFSGRLRSATASMADHVLISAEPVELAFHGNTVRAEALTYYSSEARAIFTGNVRVHLERAPTEGEK
jgi:lipopolysaccharide export system protein LptC